jgi:uncharacterized protein (TIGR03118 family)
VNPSQKSHRRQIFAVVLSLAAALLIQPAAAQVDNVYIVTNLISDDGSVPGTVADPNLINGWGITASATSPWWVSSADMSVATLYTGAGVVNSLVVNVSGNPTGTVFYGGAGFLVTNGTTTAPARFMFAAEDGSISGWNPGVLPPAGAPPSTQAWVGLPASGGASYKGLALAQTADGDFLYAADFHNAKVDIVNSTWDVVSTPTTFVDPHLPKGYAPFGIQNINGRIFVTYGKQDEEAEEEVTGRGLGVVSVFDTAGAFLGRVATGGALNAPWGVALAPDGFGRFSGDLLVGNFGDGRINAFDFETFEPRGHLKGADHKPIVVDGLWGIGFGNDAGSGSTKALYFAAGPEDETHGLFGKIDAQ